MKNEPGADARCMARALELARRGNYTAAPNPRVGCVVVKDGKVVGEGWHRRTGEAHAEIIALGQAGEAARGATIYLTLEPCAHSGRTPPCSNTLIAAGVARAMIAVRDPNPLVAGKGVAALEAVGIETSVGLCEDEARELNVGFFSRMERHRPWVRIKWGMSLDGRVAPASGDSRWITGEDARHDVQFARARCSALLTGAGTVLADNPRLNVRLNAGELGIESDIRQPLRVVADSGLRTRPDAQIHRLPGDTVVATCSDDAAARAVFEDAGIEIWRFTPRNGRVPLESLLKRLAEREINEVQVEAGPGVSGALIEHGLYDEILLYVAPCLLGGVGVPPAGLDRIASVEQREALAWREVRRVGNDLRILMRKGE